MKYKNFLFLTLTILATPFCVNSQDFEGRFSYINYSVLENGDTIESSSMNYWIKEHYFKYSGYVVKAPLVDLGTLYADADKMTRTNINSSGQIDRVPISTEPNTLILEIEATNTFEKVLGFNCQIWSLIDIKSRNIVSTVWVTEEILNSNYDQFVELFNYQSTLFPCKGIKGWILKREDFRRADKVFVTEVKEIKAVKLKTSEMIVY